MKREERKQVKPTGIIRRSHTRKASALFKSAQSKIALEAEEMQTAHQRKGSGVAPQKQRKGTPGHSVHFAPGLGQPGQHSHTAEQNNLSAFGSKSVACFDRYPRKL